MLSYPEFINFARSLRDKSVLTVYVSSACHDPSTKDVWRVQLDHAIDAARNGLLNASHDEQLKFEQCVELLERQLEASPNLHNAPGWVAFITMGAVRRAESLPIEVPTNVAWSVGPYVTPYVCAIVQDQDGVVAVTDARKVTLYQYANGSITRRHVIHAHPHLRPPIHMGDVPHQGFRPGVRGETGHEAAERIRETGTQRMLRDAANHIIRLAGTNGWILIGGIPESGRRLMHQLSDAGSGRLLQLDSLDVHSSPTVIAEAARRGMSIIQNIAAAQRVSQLVTTGNNNGRIACKPDAVRQALEQARVHELYVTDRYLNRYSGDAEKALRMAIYQRAHVSVITGPAGHTLDDYGGAAARLRYVIPSAA